MPVSIGLLGAYEQWGVNSQNTNGRNPVIFPIAYNKVFTATSSTDYLSANSLDDLTNTQFKTRINSDSGNGSFRWIAIGL